jgi:membrane-associated HD superfamily phosphohydrolase
MPKRKTTEEEEFLKRLDELEFNETKPRRKRKKRTKKENHLPGYFSSILISGLLLYGLNNISSFDIPFLTLDFQRVLPIINVSLGVAIFCSFLLVLDDDGKFGSFLRIVQNLFAIFLVYSLYNIFPFTFSSISNSVLVSTSLKVALLATIVGLGVATILEFLKLAFEK